MSPSARGGPIRLTTKRNHRPSLLDQPIRNIHQLTISNSKNYHYYYHYNELTASLVEISNLHEHESQQRAKKRIRLVCLISAKQLSNRTIIFQLSKSRNSANKQKQAQPNQHQHRCRRRGTQSTAAQAASYIGSQPTPTPPRCWAESRASRSAMRL